MLQRCRGCDFDLCSECASKVSMVEVSDDVLGAVSAAAAAAPPVGRVNFCIDRNDSHCHTPSNNAEIKWINDGASTLTRWTSLVNRVCLRAYHALHNCSAINHRAVFVSTRPSPARCAPRSSTARSPQSQTCSTTVSPAACSTPCSYVAAPCPSLSAATHWVHSPCLACLCPKACFTLESRSPAITDSAANAEIADANNTAVVQFVTENSRRALDSSGSPATLLSSADFTATVRHHRASLQRKFTQLQGVMPRGVLAESSDSGYVRSCVYSTVGAVELVEPPTLYMCALLDLVHCHNLESTRHKRVLFELPALLVCRSGARTSTSLLKSRICFGTSW